ARLARRHVGQVGARAFRPGKRRGLVRVVRGDGGPAIGAVQRKVPGEMGGAGPTPLAQGDRPAPPRGGASGRRAPGPASILNARRRKNRNQHRECDVAGKCEADDGAMAGVCPHGDTSTAGAAGACASARPGRIAQTFTANTAWLVTISTPPAVRHSHIGSAASTDRMKDSPATHAKPWRMPAIEIDTT